MSGKKEAKVTLAKLEKQKQKHESAGEKDKAADVQKTIAKVVQWQEDFKAQCPVTEGDLKKRLIADAQKVLNHVTKLIEKRDELNLEVTENERKHLDKARKWSQLVVDCKLALSSRDKVDFDRIYDIKNEVERLKCLDNDIECMRNIRAQFAAIDEWHSQLDTVTQVD